MSQLSKTSFGNLYGTSGTTFPDNTTGLISEGDVRTFGEDIKDSFLNISDNFIDEDSFATDSATKVPSQQSVKAYVNSLGSSSISKTIISVSSAEILALNATPKELIAAPGANKALFIHGVQIMYDFVSSAYATNTTLQLIYGPVVWANDAGALLTRVTDGFEVFPNPTTALQHGLNFAFSIKVATGNPTAGDSTMKVIVYYSVEDL